MFTNIRILIVSFCCVALLPSTIQQNDDEKLKREIDRLKGTLDAMALMDEPEFRINGIFRLSYNGFLGSGGFALTYKGAFEGEWLIHNKKEVAMKFTLPEKKEMAKKEYDIYTYLKAINDPAVESNGIPTVYYYGPCGKYTLMAMTLLEPTFHQKYRNEILEYEDILILFREFVRISKYMHSCGVRHDDIKPGNIMFRKSRPFIIDYNLASKMNEYNEGGTLPYCARASQVGMTRAAKDDWESFLYSMCRIVHYDLGWFSFKDPNAVRNLKMNTTKTLEKIGNMTNPLYREIFSHFAHYVLDDNKPNFPDYDEFYGYFHRKKPNLHFVSWQAPAHLDFYKLDISHIVDPRQLLLNEEFYPKPIYNFFTDMYGVPETNDNIFN